MKKRIYSASVDRRAASKAMILSGASLLTWIVLSASPAYAERLQASYNPAANNGGGAAPGRSDIITLSGKTDVIKGDYTLRGKTARRFLHNTTPLSNRAALGQIVSGYAAVDGRSVLTLGAEQKTLSITYPDQIQGTQVAVTVYDNARLGEVASTSILTNNYSDTGRLVYGDVRLANITNSNVTIQTGDKSKDVYNGINFALLAVDTGSTLYNVSNDSNIIYDSKTATLSGIDQNGLSQAATSTYNVPVTSYSGVAFNGNDSVTDLESLKRYNSSLIAQLQGGAITPTDYERLIKASVTTTTQPVVVANRVIPRYVAPPTTSRRLFMRLNDSTLTTTADSQLVGSLFADEHDDGGNTLILAENGSTIVNNGSISHAGRNVAIDLTGNGTSLTNNAMGVIGIGYETLTDNGAVRVPKGVGTTAQGQGQSVNNIAIRAQDGATVNNQGIINVANRDITTDFIAAPGNKQLGKANSGIVVSSGATASNSGVILIGGADSAVANTLGSFRGAAGMVAYDGGTATNASGGMIRIGSSFAGNVADLANLADVLSVNYASGMTSLSGAGSIVNNGTISIASRAQNATGMKVGGVGNIAVNNGTIVIDPTSITTPTQRNAAIQILGGANDATFVNARNSATGSIEISGMNGVGLLVENEVDGGFARAANDGTITVNGGVSTDRLRNYGIYVGNASSSAAQNGLVILNGDGAVGVHARNGGKVDTGVDAMVDFRSSNQIGYYALGAGSEISINSVTTVDTQGSTGLRIEGGAIARGNTLTFNVSGPNAIGIVASGASTGPTVDTTGMRVNVSGAGAVGILVEGGATGVITAGSDLLLSGQNTTAAIVDGQRHALDGSNIGTPVATTAITSAADLSSVFANVTGYVAQNQAQLVNSGNITFTGIDSTGIIARTGANVSNSGVITLGGGNSIGMDIDGLGTTGTLTGSISGTGTGVRIANGGAFTNNGAITMALGTGILIEGAGSALTGTGPSAVTASDGTAALRLVNGGSVNTSGNFVGGGTAHGVLVDTGAGAVTLGNGTITTNGTGNGIENAANSSTILLNGTTVTANGSGTAVRTAVSLDPASQATLAAAGTNSTGYYFAGTNGSAISNDLTLGNTLTIVASGAGATGLRMNSSGNGTLNGQIRVTSAQGGSAVVAGPAALLTNTGSLVSASTVAPVVSLTGGTGAFTNSGTITAASSTGTAIAGGNNGQSVTLAGGAVTGAVTLGSGNDTFLMSGGTLTGAVSTGGGDDLATFRGLTNANLAGVTSIAGNAVVGGNDRLVFDGTTSTGTQRLTGWNMVSLTNASNLTSDGDLTLAGGNVAIQSGSTYFAGNGVRGAIASTAGGQLTVTNAGTIDLTNGSSGATDTLTIRGNYVGQGGTLRLNTVLGTDGSPSDRLIIDGGAVSGTTSIQVVNAGGLGAQTTGNGIEVISAINGGTTTATTTGTGFTLAGEHVDAGAFEYRLFGSNQTGTNESWYLRTSTNGQAENPGTPTNPTTPTTPTEPSVPSDPAAVNLTYRVEAPLLAALPNVLRFADLSMLATYHKRMGDETAAVADRFTAPGRVWGRILTEDGSFRQTGTVRPEANGNVYGFQLGVDLFRFGNDKGHHDVGIYGGYTDGNYGVRGFASGIQNQYVGKLKPNAIYAGAYWSYLANNGFYSDVVVQRSFYGGKAMAINGNRIDIDGSGILASVEAGYGIALSSRWTLEPQVQVIAQGVSINDATIPNATVVQDSDGQITGRIGLRAKGRFDAGSGSIQPYARFNLWRAFASTDRTLYRTAAATTIIPTFNSSIWGEAGAGLTWSLSPRLALFGEVDHRFSLDNDRGVVGHTTGGSVGIKASF
jgi:autotransporter family porin